MKEHDNRLSHISYQFSPQFCVICSPFIRNIYFWLSTLLYSIDLFINKIELISSSILQQIPSAKHLHMI